ncbi:Mth938-like domain-containing protein [Oceanibium sediminis]|uniref:Mth938-like domain-containing protein n=1 Tax=Oceanibium sediminis TaxID=2026339 RepID=UPI000DD33F7A|nr:Mth938-like domain-containing protein [Oceanibium sediminis]
MKLTEVTFQAGQPVEGYGPGFFRLGEQAHEGPLLILPGGVVDGWSGLSDTEALIGARADYDVLLIGVGAEIAPLPGEARRALDAADIPYDVMGTGPALRTYNVLLAEERRVALAVLPV